MIGFRPAVTWTGRPPLAIAHQGGAAEAPSSTMFAFARAVAHGADMLELDVHATADRELVVIHDATVDRTTDGTGRVDEMTLAQLQRLDAAHWFVRDLGAVHDRPREAYQLRGVATGATAPPAGSAAGDFTVPTLRDVLTRFTSVRVNVDIKETAPAVQPYERLVADTIRACGRSHDVMVASFSDAALLSFRRLAPEVATSAGPTETVAFWSYAHGGQPPSDLPYRALQVPSVYGDLDVVTPDLIAAARRHDVAVHVWTIDDAVTMRRLLELGVDGIVTDRPSVLRDVAARRDRD